MSFLLLCGLLVEAFLVAFSFNFILFYSYFFLIYVTQDLSAYFAYLSSLPRFASALSWRGRQRRSFLTSEFGVARFRPIKTPDVPYLLRLTTSQPTASFSLFSLPFPIVRFRVSSAGG